MSILHRIMETEAKVFTTRTLRAGEYHLLEGPGVRLLLSAEIERSMISSRTKEALARKKSEGMRLGGATRKLAKETKLTGKRSQQRSAYHTVPSLGSLG
jgi:hypothetical protein